MMIGVEGYHIEFDREGYMIEPHWIEETATHKWPPKVDGNGDYFETCLRLKLDAKTIKNFSRLYQNLEEVFDEKLILFLNKLEKMIFEDRYKNRSIEHMRVRLTHHWMSVASSYRNYSNFIKYHNNEDDQSRNNNKKSSGTESFWFLKKLCFTPEVSRNQDALLPMHETELILAIPFIKTLDKSNDAINSKKTAIIGNDVENTNREEVIYSLRMDRSKHLLPIYAYLPTKSLYFSFVIQGDFILSTNRESILESNEWNQHLLDHIPSLFIETILEISQFVWEKSCQDLNEQNVLDDIIINNDALKEITSEFGMIISFNDLLHLLPRLSTNPSPVYRHLITKIYKDLMNTKFLLSESNIFCSPHELIYVNHLPYEISKLISEDVLYELIGKRYMNKQIELDSELISLLNISVFDINIVLVCLESLSKSLCTSKVSDDTYLRRLCGCFLSISMLTAKNANDSLNHLTTTQRTKHTTPMGSHYNNILSYHQSDFISTARNQLGMKDIQRLSKLQVWPTSNEVYISLENTVLLIHNEKKENSLTYAQLDCIKIFKNKLLVLNELLFQVSENLWLDGSNRLKSFLLNHFRVNPLHKYEGGIEEITPDNIIRNVILPSYSWYLEKKRINNNGDPEKDVILSVTDNNHNHDNDNYGYMDRETAAAYLAFIYLSKGEIIANSTDAAMNEIGKYLKQHGFIVPVLFAKDKNISSQNTKKKQHVDSMGKSALFWSSPSCSIVRPQYKDTVSKPKAVNEEVHLGVECQDSATNILAGLSCVTLMRQLSYSIIDPMVLALATGKYASFMSYKSSIGSGYDHESLYRQSIQWYASYKDMSMYKLFLEKIGIVNFFGIYKYCIEGVSYRLENKQLLLPYHTPFLFDFISNLIRNGIVLRTDCKKKKRNMSPWNNLIQSNDTVSSGDVTGTGDSSEDENQEMDEEVDEAEEESDALNGYFPLYLAYPDDCVLRVSENSYKVMKVRKPRFRTIFGRKFCDDMNHYHLLLILMFQYYFLQAIVRILMNDLLSKPSELTGSQSYFIYKLNSLPWFPVSIDPTLACNVRLNSFLATEHNQSDFYVLTSPRNAIIVEVRNVR